MPISTIHGNMKEGTKLYLHRKLDSWSHDLLELIHQFFFEWHMVFQFTKWNLCYCSFLISKETSTISHQFGGLLHLGQVNLNTYKLEDIRTLILLRRPFLPHLTIVPPKLVFSFLFYTRFPPILLHYMLQVKFGFLNIWVIPLHDD